MENSSFVALSRQQALQTRMDLIANNVANMSTPGYRAQNMVFSEYLSKPQKNEDSLSLVSNYGQYQDSAPGVISSTGNPLDVALNGPGYLLAGAPDGQTAYTKAGNLRINANGELLTAAGAPILGEGGTGLTIPTDATNLKIARDGTISSDQGELGRLKIVEFKNIQELRPIGNALYVTEAPPIEDAVNTTLVQGALESSNVTPVQEMTRLIEVSRMYQGTQNLLQTEHERQRTMIRQLSQN